MTLVHTTTSANQAIQRAANGSMKDLASVLRALTDGHFRPMFSQPAPATPTDTATLTAAQLLTLILSSTPTAAAAYTLPLGADLEAALVAAYPTPSLQVNDSFDFSVINLATGNFDITMTTNTGWTLVGNMVVQESAAATGSLSTASFRVRRTAASTYTLYRVG